MSDRACIKCRSTRVMQIQQRPSWFSRLFSGGKSLLRCYDYIVGIKPDQAESKVSCQFCGQINYPIYRCPDCNAVLCNKCTPKAEPKPEPKPTPPPLSAEDRTKASVDQARHEYTNRCEMIDGMVTDGTLDESEAEAMKDKAKQKMLRAIDGVMG